MFEAIVAICVSLSDGLCRDQLLPGFEAETVEACQDKLARRPPSVEGLVTRGDPVCRAVGPALDVTEVAPGVFVHRGEIAEPDMTNRGDVANFGFVIGDAGIAVIDTGAARWIGEEMWRAIRARSDLPVTHVILTHTHPDHVLGVSVFADAGADVVGHVGLPRALSDRQANYLESLERLIGTDAFLGSVLTPIDVTVEDIMTVDLGSRVLELRTWPSAHTGADMTVLDRATGTLFAGDLVFHMHIPALDGKLRGWQAVLDDMAAMDVDRIVPGHGGPSVTWPDGALAMQRYLGVLAQDTRRAVDQGQRLGEAIQTIAESEAPNWLLFDAFNPRNATVAFTELEWE